MTYMWLVELKNGQKKEAARLRQPLLQIKNLR